MRHLPGKIRSQSGALTAGIVLACVLRYICHVISGCTVWAGVSIPDAAALWYSIVYNATYMLPETLVCVVGAQCICRMLDFREAHHPVGSPAEGSGSGGTLPWARHRMSGGGRGV